MQHYSNVMKNSMVSKLCTPGGPSVIELADETGIGRSTLYLWVNQFGKEYRVDSERRPDDWSAEERLDAVLEAQNLDGNALGEFLRKNGLHSNNIEDWKSDLTDLVGEAIRARGRPRKDPKLTAAELEIKKLKRDLRRQEKALAEQTALIILKKKVQAIWGTEEDDE